MSDDLVNRLRIGSLYSDDEMIMRHEAADRIAELEAALKDMAKYIWRDDYQKLEPTTRAALGDKK